MHNLRTFLVPLLCYSRGPIVPTLIKFHKSRTNENVVLIDEGQIASTRARNEALLILFIDSVFV